MLDFKDKINHSFNHGNVPICNKCVYVDKLYPFCSHFNRSSLAKCVYNVTQGTQFNVGPQFLVTFALRFMSKIFILFLVLIACPEYKAIFFRMDGIWIIKYHCLYGYPFYVSYDLDLISGQLSVCVYVCVYVCVCRVL